jgi:hypothetical protein
MRARAVAVLTAVLLVVGVTAGAATADEQVLRDPAGDMWRTQFAGGTAEAPQMRLGDVRRAVFRHGRPDIVVRQRFTELRRAGRYAQYTVRLQSGSGQYREVVVSAAPRSWRGTVAVFNRRDRVGCEATHRIDYAANTVVMTVPRSCLGDPERVRGAAANSWAHQRDDEFLSDNPHHTRAVVRARTWSRWLPVG